MDKDRFWDAISPIGWTENIFSNSKLHFLDVIRNILILRREKYAGLKWLPLLAISIFFVAVTATSTFLNSELFVRYVFGFTGALLTAIAFLEIRKIALENRLEKLVKGSTLMAIAFGFYTVFGGLITFTILGIPPQPIRMVCALLAAYASFGLLTVLETGLGRKKRK